MTQRTPRLFSVSWNNAHKNTRDQRRYDNQEAWGTQYPNGHVSLDNGAHFAMLSELEAFLEEHGEYTLAFLDEGADDREDIERRDHFASRVQNTMRMIYGGGNA